MKETFHYWSPPFLGHDLPDILQYGRVGKLVVGSAIGGWWGDIVDKVGEGIGLWIPFPSHYWAPSADLGPFHIGIPSHHHHRHRYRHPCGCEEVWI